MKKKGQLALDLPPNFFPFIKPGEPDWHSRYKKFNMPGEYHNGGIWPFIVGFYITALVAAKKYQLAEEKLLVLTEVVKSSNTKLNKKLKFGFNEWLKAQNGKPKGQNWQTWSAALYLYAAKCVEERTTIWVSKKHFKISRDEFTIILKNIRMSNREFIASLEFSMIQS